MIRRLKRRFVALAMTALGVLIALILAGMNLINYRSTVAEADELLALLSTNKGRFPGFDSGGFDYTAPPKMPEHMSPETPYESRYFWVLMDSAGNPVSVETSAIAAVDSSEAIALAKKIFSGGRQKGFEGDLRFVLTAENDRVRVTFLDWGRRLDGFRGFLFTSCLIGFAGYGLFFLAIFFFSGRIIRPIAEAYEKQRRFITDAGHELKTPLTIINANADLLEMEYGNNESVDDIRTQASRLTSLTNDLIFLSRMEESDSPPTFIELPLSELVSETASAFRGPAAAKNKELVCSVVPMLSCRGDQKAICQLVSIVTDNAVKYSPEGGRIELGLSRQGKNILLEVSNPTEAPVSEDELGRIFDRFYRADPSRSSRTGGHGIGLSVASAIVKSHGGRIRARYENGRFFLSVTLPS